MGLGFILVFSGSHPFIFSTNPWPQEGLANKGQFRSIRGCRVRRLEKCEGPPYKSHVWKLYGNPGNQAHHEATELDVKTADDQYLGTLQMKDEWNSEGYIMISVVCLSVYAKTTESKSQAMKRD